MLNKVSQQIAELLCTNKDASDTKEICSYGIELALHTFLSTAGLLIIGALMHHLLEAAVIISIYYANQTIGGGFHAKSHLMCFTVMAVVLVSCIVLINLPLPNYLVYSAAVTSCGYLWFHPVCLHRNKMYLLLRIRLLKTRSRVTILLLVMASGILLVLARGQAIRQCGCISLVTSGISRAFGIAREKYSLHQQLHAPK